MALTFDLADHELHVRDTERAAIIEWRGVLLIALEKTEDGLLYSNQSGASTTFDTAEDAARFIAVERGIVRAADL